MVGNREAAPTMAANGQSGDVILFLMSISQTRTMRNSCLPEPSGNGCMSPSAN